MAIFLLFLVIYGLVELVSKDTNSTALSINSLLIKKNICQKISLDSHIGVFNKFIT